jgi:hypothetical protein
MVEHCLLLPGVPSSFDLAWREGAYCQCVAYVSRPWCMSKEGCGDDGGRRTDERWSFELIRRPAAHCMHGGAIFAGIEPKSGGNELLESFVHAWQERLTSLSLCGLTLSVSTRQDFKVRYARRTCQTCKMYKKDQRGGGHHHHHLLSGMAAVDHRPLVSPTQPCDTSALVARQCS